MLTDEGRSRVLAIWEDVLQGAASMAGQATSAIFNTVLLGKIEGTHSLARELGIDRDELRRVAEEAIGADAYAALCDVVPLG